MSAEKSAHAAEVAPEHQVLGADIYWSPVYMLRRSIALRTYYWTRFDCLDKPAPCRLHSLKHLALSQGRLASSPRMKRSRGLQAKLCYDSLA